MSTNTTIEWADKTWSPIIGCDRVSPGCDRCYAMGVARIREFNPNPKIKAAFAGTTLNDGNGVDWTGKVNLLDDRLTEPLRWKKPAKVFVNSMSDLFHKDVPDEFIARVFAVMALTSQHTYQILTKRHARMRSLLSDPAFEKQVDRELLTVPALSDPKLTRRPWPLPKPGWPLSNVWLGVSVENQQWADIRIPALLETPAAVRWISAEPLIGPVDLTRVAAGSKQQPKMVFDAVGQRYGVPGAWQARSSARLDWVVVGGESGHGARPMHPDWAATIRNQCAHSGVPFLFKQWGEWGPMAPLDANGCFDFSRGHALANDGTLYAPGDIDYPNGPRYGEALRADHGRAHLTSMYRLGKKAAGRELDGRTWDQYPVVPR